MASKQRPVSLPFVDITPKNVDKEGFFCCMSKRKSVGYRAKRAWLDKRFAEGIRLSLLGDGERGFIEYIPGENTSRAIDGAEGYYVIHCLWVVGKSKHKGLGASLLKRCIEDARSKAKGVAIVTNDGVWIPSRTLFEREGFECVDEAPGGFQLLCMRFGEDEPPRFPMNWDERCRRFGPGLAIAYADQCPYVDDAIVHMERAAEKHGIACRRVKLETPADARANSPTPYGVFGAVLDGRLFSYHYMLEKDFAKRIAEMQVKR